MKILFPDVTGTKDPPAMKPPKTEHDRDGRTSGRSIPKGLQPAVAAPAETSGYNAEVYCIPEGCQNQEVRRFG